MKAADERGVALVLVLIMMAVLSVLGASLVFVSQTETWSSQNYRLMTGARYAAESGVHKAANFILNSYTAPADTGTDLMSNYTITTSPVQYGGNAVQLRSADTLSNYPVTAVKTAFINNVHGALAGGTDTVTYDAIATLVSMRQITVYGSTTPATVQTWRIVGRGTLTGAKPARVDVEAVLERQVNPVFSYAAFAVDDGCGALGWQGNARTYSYDSAIGPSADPWGGNVGTNGNLNLTGNAEINGTLSTPRAGVGTCSAGNVTALTGSLLDTDGLVELPQPVIYPPPAAPTVWSSNPVTLNNGTLALAPGTYGNLTIKGLLQLSPGTYNINSITMSGQGSVQVTPLTGSVILNVAGFATAGTYEAVPSMACPIDLQGGSTMNVATYDPTKFQIVYAGTKLIQLRGNSAIAGLVYAPSAEASFGGTPDWYGAVIVKRILDFGTANIHYDRRLSMSAVTLGAWMMNSFTWRRF
jgi:Tfp pilus assembly protein PilX